MKIALNLSCETFSVKGFARASGDISLFPLVLSFPFLLLLFLMGGIFDKREENKLE